MPIRACTVFCAIVMVTSCKADAFGPGTAGVEWHLVSFGSTVTHPPASQLDATFKLFPEVPEKGQLLGQDFCNGFGALYVFPNSWTITVIGFSSTLVGCFEPGRDDDPESVFFDRLRDSRTFTLQAGQLTLITSRGDSLMFEAR
jgi:heat shock protein HslJ